MGIWYYLVFLGIIGGLGFGTVVLLTAIPGLAGGLAELYPMTWLRWKLGRGPDPRSWRFAMDVIGDEEPKVNPNSTWKVNVHGRVSACYNRPGLKKIYVTVLDEVGLPLRGVKVRFETELSEGIAYDHLNVWGTTDANGYLEWDHLGVPTRYVTFVEGDETPLIENIRTDLGNEYCNPGIGGWRPVNKPGIYSYRFEIQEKGGGVPFQPPVISDVQVQVLDDDQPEGCARVVVAWKTDVVAEGRVFYSLRFEGGRPGEELQPACDPFSVGGWRSPLLGPGLDHVVELSGRSLWYSREASKEYCLVIVAWLPEYRHWWRGKGYSEVVSFTLPHEA